MSSSLVLSCDTLPVGLLPIRGLVASFPRIFCLLPISAIIFLLFSVIYYNLEHPDKNRVLKF